MVGSLRMWGYLVIWKIVLWRRRWVEVFLGFLLCLGLFVFGSILKVFVLVV